MSTEDDDLDDGTEPVDLDEGQPTAQPTVDSATPQGRRRQRTRMEREQEEIREFWKRIFADPIGRREMWRILDGDSSLHAFDAGMPVSPVGMPYTEAAWHRLGQRDYGLGLYRRWMGFTPDGVMLMHVEHDPMIPKKPQDKNA